MVGDADRPVTSFPGRNKGESTSVVRAEESDAAPASVEVSDAVPPASDGTGVVPPPAKKPPTMPTGLAHPEGWPEAHRPPGLSAEFSVEEWEQIKASADAALGGTRLVKYWKRAYREAEDTYRLAYAEAAYWKRASARWESECGPWADVADKRSKEIDRLTEELSVVGQVTKALQQTSAEQERDLKTFQQNYGALKARNESLERKLGEVQARLEASEKELAGARSEAQSAALEKSRLEADFDAALAQKEEELKAATLQAEGASREHAAVQALLTDSRAEVERLTTGLREVLAEAKSASEAHDREAASFRLEMEDRLTRAIADYKASQPFQDEIDESGSYSYELGFQDGLQQVRASYPNLDLSIVKRAGKGADEDAAGDLSEDLDGEDEGPPASGGA